MAKNGSHQRLEACEPCSRSKGTPSAAPEVRTQKVRRSVLTMFMKIFRIAKINIQTHPNTTPYIILAFSSLCSLHHPQAQRLTAGPRGRLQLRPFNATDFLLCKYQSAANDSSILFKPTQATSLEKTVTVDYAAGRNPSQFLFVETR